MPALKKCLFLAVALAAAMSLTAARPCAAETWIVNSTADDGTPGTLRNALYNASAGDIISITATGTIYLDTVTGPLIVDKSVTITGPGRDNLTIDGGHQAVVVQNGGAGTPVFWVGFSMVGPMPEVTASISGLTIAHGAYDYGGGIANGGTLTVEDCALTDNYATLLGGAIINAGNLTLTGCTLSGNSVDPQGLGGGAIFNVAGGFVSSMVIENCTLSGNSASDGGAIYTLSTMGSGLPGTVAVSIVGSVLSGNSVEADFTVGGGAIYQRCDGPGTVSSVSIDTSTLSDNSATSTTSEAYGGAVLQQSSFDATSCTLTVTNSTISGNSASGFYYGWGGAIVSGQYTPVTTATCSVVIQNSTLADNYASYAIGAIDNIGGPLTIDNSTFSGNEDGGGYVSGVDSSYGGTVSMKNTILANSPWGANLSMSDSTFTSLGHNLCTDGGNGFLDAASDQINTDPLLGPLADNGGPTWTCALLPGSPAIDAGDSLDSFGNAVTADQRGITRPQGAANDIGAFEAKVSALTVSLATVTKPNLKSKIYTVTVTITNQSTATAYNVSVTAATLAGINTNSRLPLLYGTIKPGASKQVKLQFKNVPSGQQTFTLDGTSSIGAFYSTQDVNVP